MWLTVLYMRLSKHHRPSDRRTMVDSQLPCSLMDVNTIQERKRIFDNLSKVFDGRSSVEVVFRSLAVNMKRIESLDLIIL